MIASLGTSLESRETLELSGLPSDWVRNIMHCVDSTRLMSIVWGGERMDWFKPTRGIRQGDSISLYLFVLCMERLGHLINLAVAERRWEPLKLYLSGPNLSHLFFADDLLLFVEASENQIISIMEYLNQFCSLRSEGELGKMKYFLLPRGRYFNS